VVLIREMTKVFEETKRGPVGSILAGLKQDRPRGEYTLVLEGSKEEETAALKED